MESDSFPQTLGDALRPSATSGTDPFARAVELLRGRGTGRGVRVRTQNLKGAARGYVLSRLQRALKVPLVCVAQDEEEAERLANDLAFFLGGVGSLEKPNVV